jgi:hypothetical protein
MVPFLPWFLRGRCATRMRLRQAKSTTVLGSIQAKLASLVTDDERAGSGLGQS